MCKRFVHHLSWSEVVGLYRLIDAPAPPTGFRARYNIAPGQSVLVVAQGDHGMEARMMRWGFIPARAKTKPRMTPINVRAETVATSRLFRSAFRVRRCLVPASGFYEWQKQPGKRKGPYWLGMRDGRPFSIAGIWEPSHGDDASDTFALITTEPNSLTATFHQRMPVIVAQGDYDAWMRAEASAVQNLMRPYPAEAMKTYPLGKRVNDPQNDDPALLFPATPEAV